MQIKVNNVNIYYEVYGKGKPIILLHGNSETHKIFTKLIKDLKSKYQIYALDSRCHGQSDNSQKISYDLMSNDVIEFIKKLNIEKTILYGFSDGGIIGLLVAIKEPKILSKLIISGANLNPKGLKKYFLTLTKLGFFFTRNKKFKMILKEPNIKIEELQKISIPTVILVGEKDIVKKEHTKLINQSIKNSTLEIISKENHGSYIVNSHKLTKILQKYL